MYRYSFVLLFISMLFLNSCQQSDNTVATHTKTPLLKINVHTLKKQNKYQYTLIAQTKLNSIKEFEHIVIKVLDSGEKVYLKDIARIELGSESYRSSAFVNNTPSAQLGIFQLPSANALKVASNIEKKIQELKKRFPNSITMKPTYDTGSVKNSVSI